VPPATPPPVAEAPPPPPPVKGAMPFGFPSVQTTTAKVGDYVLCPPREWIDKALADPSETLIYYTSTMLEPGELESKVRSLVGDEMSIPNGMLIPIPSGERAEPGDIVLTWWQSGSGMQRSIVVPGGTPEAPSVLHLDIDYDNPSGAGKNVDTLRANSFHKLAAEWELGTAVACKGDGGYKHGIITALQGDKVLAHGFAGGMKVYDKATCVPLPVRPQLKTGDTVWFESFGGFSEGVVKNVDSKIGRAFVEFDFAGEKRQEAVPFGNISATPLP
jgi:hypothetical protein